MLMFPLCLRIIQSLGLGRRPHRHRTRSPKGVRMGLLYQATTDTMMTTTTTIMDPCQCLEALETKPATAFESLWKGRSGGERKWRLE